jgi:hypothetical protein
LYCAGKKEDGEREIVNIYDPENPVYSSEELSTGDEED